ncbi:hypothetical protein ACVILH_002884 [Bradyrhizobium sp. USDA 4353]
MNGESETTVRHGGTRSIWTKHAEMHEVCTFPKHQSDSQVVACFWSQ